MKKKVIDYSAHSVAVFTETKREKELREHHGLFNLSLKYNGNETDKRPGWVFGRKRKADVEKLAKRFNLEVQVYNPEKGSLAVFGEVEDHVKTLLNAKGRFNAGLTDDKGNKFPGWIFPKGKDGKKETEVVELVKKLS